MNLSTIHGGETMEVISTIGINIMKLRKAEGFTQMELAEIMGVSFQAVSNWERGISCPDIEKLTELSKLFHTSVDAIIGNDRTMAAINAVCQEESSATAEDVQEAAPFVTQEQTDQAANKGSFSIDDLVKVAPFVSQKLIDEVAEKNFKETGCLKDIQKIIPFVSNKLLEFFAEEEYAKTAEFKTVNTLLPFISTRKLEKLARMAYEKGGMSAIQHAAPFLPTEMMDELAKDALKKYGLAGLSPVLPFISSYILEEFLKSGNGNFDAK